MKIHIEVSKDLKVKLKKLSKETSRSISWLVRKSLTNYLKARKII